MCVRMPVVYCVTAAPIACWGGGGVRATCVDVLSPSASLGPSPSLPSFVSPPAPRWATALCFASCLPVPTPSLHAPSPPPQSPHTLALPRSFPPPPLPTTHTPGG